MSSDEPDYAFQEQITALVDKVGPLLEELRANGVNVLMLTHYFDPMTRQAYVQWREVGDRTALLGAVEEYRWSRSSEVRWVHGESEG